MDTSPLLGTILVNLQLTQALVAHLPMLFTGSFGLCSKDIGKQMQTSNTTWANISHLCFFGYTLPACLINIERDHNDRP